MESAVCAIALAVAAVLGGVTPAISHAAPAAATKDFSNPAIVILGYGLNPDGTMRTILRRRVLTGLAVAQFFPESPIIVTGGNPQNGKTEAGQMHNMLRSLGVPDDRIIVEDKANSTVQNAQFSVPLAEQAGRLRHHPGHLDDPPGPGRRQLRRRRRQSAGNGELSRTAIRRSTSPSSPGTRSARS